jgi:acyl carrier protein
MSYIYRTGDLGRWLIDENNQGNIEFLGRKDFQVKLRGYRIELEQIEAQLIKYPDIKEALVDVKGKEDNKYLCAYIIPGAAASVNMAQLKEYLRERLLYYMIPTYFVEIKKFPLTPNGKIDRKALPQPEAGKTGEEYVAPTSQLEKQLADILKEVLRIDKVGINDNFFDIGGNSLNLVQVNSKLKEVLGKDIPIVNMFQYPTIRTLCSHMARIEKGESNTCQQQKEQEELKNVSDTMAETVGMFENL